MNMARFPLSAATPELAPTRAAATPEQFELALLRAIDASPMPVSHPLAVACMRHAAPLDAENAPFISIHRRIWSDQAKDFIFPGSAHTSYETAIRNAHYWSNKDYCTYWATAAQMTAGEHVQGHPYPKASRKRANYAGRQNLCLDMDVKPSAHPTTRDAAEALIGFARDLGAVPSMVIGSGNGGLHVYWRTPRMLTLKEFDPMAANLVKAAATYGLKFDAQCTSDAMRLMRVPGTWNFKNADADGATPATLVTLFYLGDQQ